MIEFVLCLVLNGYVQSSPAVEFREKAQKIETVSCLLAGDIDYIASIPEEKKRIKAWKRLLTTDLLFVKVSVLKQIESIGKEVGFPLK